MIQGPPGTGKTKTAVSIILAQAAAGKKILLAAGSNKAVDNLAHAVFKTFKAQREVRKWVGDLVRFRTPSFLMSAVRKHSASTVPIRRLGDLSSLEKDLERCQLWTLVAWYANRNPTDRDVEVYERLARKDLASGLMEAETTQFKNAVEQIMRKILLRSSTRIVATTLGASANGILRLGFCPDTLVCDESGQCLEAEHVIAMTMTSLKAVILIGDPDQLPPTAISAGQTNEYARYLQRPLMSRLRDADYPLERLTINYRCHTSILEFFNRTIFGGTLIAGPRNDEVKRTGSVWDEFTATRAAFCTQNVNG